MERNETLTELEPAVAGDASVDVTIQEDGGSTVESIEGRQSQHQHQYQQQEEEDERPAVDAVVASGDSGSDPPTGTGNGDARSLPGPKEETTDREGVTIWLQDDGGRGLSPTGAAGSTGASGSGASTACTKPEVEVGASPEAEEAAVVPDAASVSGGDMPPVVVEPDASQEAVLAELVAEATAPGDDVRSAISHGDIGDPEDIGGSRRKADVVMEGGAVGVEQEAEVLRSKMLSCKSGEACALMVCRGCCYA